MDIRQLRYVVAVARRRSFTLAAADLAVAQPSLSAQIAALERELGVRLFERTKRRVVPTDAGSALLLRAERIIADLAAAAQEMSSFAGGLRGRVVLGTYQSFSEYTLPKLLGRFHALYPEIEIALREGLADDLLQQLRSGTVDAFIGDLGDARDAAMHEFASEPLYDDEIVIALSAGHPRARAAQISLGDLRDERWVIFRPGSTMTARLYALARAHGFVPRVAFESVDTMTVRSLVAEGLGVALFPRALGNTPGPNVALVSLAPERLVRHMTLVTRRTTPAPSAATFFAFIREEFLA